MINDEAREFQNVQVFASDGWHDPADASYSNLHIENSSGEEIVSTTSKYR